MTKYTTVISLALLVIYAYNTSASTLPERLCRVRRQGAGKTCRCALAAEEEVVSDMEPSVAASALGSPSQSCLKSAQPAEDPPKLFDPEVDLLSSVLGTLHKVSDQRYKEAATKEITEETNRLREAVAFKDGLLKATSKLTRDHPEIPRLPKVFDKLGTLKYREDDYVPDISRSQKVLSALTSSSNNNAPAIDSEPSASDVAPVSSGGSLGLAKLLPAPTRRPTLKLKSSTDDQDPAASDNSPTVNNTNALRQILSNDPDITQESRLKKIKNFLSSKNREKVSESGTLQSASPELADQISAAIKKSLSGTSSSYRCRIIFE